jgi:hypothetical protein
MFGKTAAKALEYACGRKVRQESDSFGSRAELGAAFTQLDVGSEGEFAVVVEMNDLPPMFQSRVDDPRGVRGAQKDQHAMPMRGPEPALQQGPGGGGTAGQGYVVEETRGEGHAVHDSVDHDAAIAAERVAGELHEEGTRQAIR